MVHWELCAVRNVDGADWECADGKNLPGWGSDFLVAARVSGSHFNADERRVDVLWHPWVSVSSGAVGEGRRAATGMAVSWGDGEGERPGSVDQLVGHRWVTDGEGAARVGCGQEGDCWGEVEAG